MCVNARRTAAFVLTALVFPSYTNAMRMAINCSSSADCATGETCVAGDSDLAIQSCVAGTVCGGNVIGNCPADEVSGQLACVLRNDIYMCLSVSRCDEFFGGTSCSSGCSSNGVACNGHGSCSVMTTSTSGVPTFGCTCEDGFTGNKCETDSSSTLSSNSRSNFGSKSESNSNFDSRSDSRFNSGSSSGFNSNSSFDSSMASTSTSSSRLSSGSSNLTVSSSSRSESKQGDNRVDPEASSGSVQSQSNGGTSSTVFIIIGVLAACILIGALLFALYSRKKKREQEADIGGAAALRGTSEFATGTGADTPKSTIVTM